MNERINSILKHFKLTSSQFADKIGVQRSSISHVLSGRNKPGFNFIQKILSRFPEINAEWLLTGTGEMLKIIHSGNKDLVESLKKRNEKKEQIEMSYDNITAESDLQRSAKTGDVKEKKKRIEKVIIIYNDKSFEEYTPAL